MATKCVAQMPLPAAKAAAPSQSSLARFSVPRARAIMLIAVKQAKKHRTAAKATSLTSCCWVMQPRT